MKKFQELKNQIVNILTDGANEVSYFETEHDGHWFLDVDVKYVVTSFQFVRLAELCYYHVQPSGKLNYDLHIIFVADV